MQVEVLELYPNRPEPKHDLLRITDARIIFKNFSGKADMYNTNGIPGFSVRIDDADIANQLQEFGWNIRIKLSSDPETPNYMNLPVKIKFNQNNPELGPKIHLVMDGHDTVLSQVTMACLDSAMITSVNCELRAYDYDFNGRTGRAAYLNAMQAFCRNNDPYANPDFTEEDVPF